MLICTSWHHTFFFWIYHEQFLRVVYWTKSSLPSLHESWNYRSVSWMHRQQLGLFLYRYVKELCTDVDIIDIFTCTSCRMLYICELFWNGAGWTRFVFEYNICFKLNIYLFCCKIFKWSDYSTGMGTFQ